MGRPTTDRRVKRRKRTGETTGGPAAFREAVLARLRLGKRVRLRGPGGVRVQVDRLMPFLVVYRCPEEGRDAGTELLLAASASAVFAPHEADVNHLVEDIVGLAGETFGAVLLIELWAAPRAASSERGTPPRLHLFAPKAKEYIPLTAFAQDVICSLPEVGAVEVVRGKGMSPPGRRALLTPARARSLGCVQYGFELPPVYQDEGGQPYPLAVRELRRGLTNALRRWAHRFLCRWTKLRVSSFQALGSRAIRRVVWDVDTKLAAVADSFDFLLQLSPVNGGEAWLEFKRSGYESTPLFQYRPLSVEPTLLKRQLFAVPIERIDDPALYQLFREKQDELDRQITMLLDVNTPRFLHGSIQLYGAIEDWLLQTSQELLELLPAKAREKRGSGKMLDARAFARRAEKELAYYREQWPEMGGRVEVRQDVTSGLMVSNGSLLIGQDSTTPAGRVEALLQHEVGTHVSTYWNGRAQPFKQLYSGLAGYDSLQEGLAVMAEHFVGGLSVPRRRLLAARVVAVQLMTSGGSFVDVFRELRRNHGFGARTAFNITLRIFRGGGLTKDAVYMRGVAELIEHLAGGGQIEPLLAGKIAAVHIPLMEELRERHILRPPPLRPRFLDLPGTANAIERIRSGLTLLELLRSRD